MSVAAAARAVPGRRRARAGSVRRRRRASVTLRYAALLLVFLVSIGPFLWQLSTSLKGATENIFSYPPKLLPASPTLGNYAKVADVIPVWRYVGNSVLVAGACTLTNCLFGAMAGYALARMRFRGRDAVFGLLLAALIVPFEVIMISEFLVVRSLGLTNSLVGVVLPSAVSVLSVFILRQAFVSLPRELEDAAVVDGASEWQVFWRIGVPAVRGSLAVVAVMSFVFAWDDFLWPLIVLRDSSRYTLTVGIAFLQGTFSADQRLIAAGTMIATVPLLVLFALLQRQFFRGVGEGAIKG
jgi:multiple sugar transport system permease protein